MFVGQCNIAHGVDFNISFFIIIVLSVAGFVQMENNKCRANT